MAKTLDYYQGLLKIDKHDLDNALMEHPDLFAEVAGEKALSISKRDQAKLELEEIEAQTDIDLRDDFARSGTKVTEALISNHVTRDVDVQAAQRKLLNAKLEAERWSALAEAFSQRGYILKDLCALYIAGYWGSRSAEGEAKTSASERTAQTARAGSYSARKDKEQA